jgi:uncharacterized protein YdeI (YjbR/CyaY-like superfamily)
MSGVGSTEPTRSGGAGFAGAGAGATAPTILFASRAEWERWLESHHGDDDGVWLKIAKKGAAVESVRYPDVLEVALCFGWIDGQRKRLDDAHFVQRFTPRRARSRWSKKNREWATRLIEAGLMREPGLREVERAQADGRWDAAYDGPRTITVPDDLERALAANPAARATFERLNGQNRYAILFRIHDAKRPETRARRIAQFVDLLARGEQLYP